MIDMTDNDLVRSLDDAEPLLPSTSEIVVGVDDDQSSGGVLRWAARQSQLTGLPLRVVHVWQMSALVAAAVTVGAHHYQEAAAGDARARATRRVVHTLGSEVRWTLEVIEGVPGPALVARSARAQLLVLCRGRRTRSSDADLGSVSQYCMSYAVPPILAVPTAVANAPTPVQLSPASTAGAVSVSA